MSEVATSQKSLMNWTRKELLALPHRDWQEESNYESLLVWGAAGLHDSKWSRIGLVGCEKQAPVEILTLYSDDIEWVTKHEAEGVGTNWRRGQMKMDCCPRSKALHFWSRDCRFHVGHVLSSLTITVYKAKL